MKKPDLEIQTFDQYHGVALSRPKTMLSDLLAILRFHNPLPSDLALLVKAFITWKGWGANWIRTLTWRTRRCLY